MKLLNVIKRRPWLVVLMFVCGLVVGGALRPEILSYTSKNGLIAGEARAGTTAETEMPSGESNSVSPEIEAKLSSDQMSVAPNLDEQEATTSEGESTSIDLTATGSYQNMPVGFTAEGFPYLGDPEAAVTLEEYSDFLCPFCGRHFDQTIPTLIEQYIAQGKVHYVFHDMPLVSLHPTAPRGHLAARCAAEQSPALFWAMHDDLFKRQNEWNRLPDPTDFLAGVAQTIGLDMTAYETCFTSGRYEAAIEESVAIGRDLDFNGTPSFQFIQHENDKTYSLVGAYPVETFEQWLDALIAGEAPPEEEEPEPPELPFWANSEGLAPDPDRPGFTLAGDPFKGNPEAKLVVVEFTDFQCDSCRRHTLETQPAVDEQFVATGKIMWVFKPFLLRTHTHAPAATVAAECAADQGQFWEMHDLLFETMEQWSRADVPDADLLALAEQLNMNMDVFQTCFNSRQALERVLFDVLDAQSVVDQTPTFIFLFGGRGNRASGVVSADQFIRRLESMLEQANSSE